MTAHRQGRYTQMAAGIAEGSAASVASELEAARRMLERLERQLANDPKLQSTQRPWRSPPKLRAKPQPAFILPQYLRAIGCGHDYSISPAPASQPAPGISALPTAHQRPGRQPGRQSDDGMYDGKAFIPPAKVDCVPRPSSSTASLRELGHSDSAIVVVPAAHKPAPRSGHAAPQQHSSPLQSPPGVDAPAAGGYHQNGMGKPAAYSEYDGKKLLNGSNPLPRNSLHGARKHGAGGLSCAAGQGHQRVRSERRERRQASGLRGGVRDTSRAGSTLLRLSATYDSLLASPPPMRTPAEVAALRNGQTPPLGPAASAASTQASLLLPRSLSFGGGSSMARIADVESLESYVFNVEGFSQGSARLRGGRRHERLESRHGQRIEDTNSIEDTKALQRQQHRPPSTRDIGAT